MKSRYAAQMMEKARLTALTTLDATQQGAATAETWMQADGQYKRVDGFQLDIVKPLLSQGLICSRGGVISITDTGLIAIGKMPDVPALAA